MHADMLDDEVAESVFRSRGVSLDMDAVTALNSDNFHPAVAQHRLTVALFYLKCEDTTHHQAPKPRFSLHETESLFRGPTSKNVFSLGGRGSLTISLVTDSHRNPNGLVRTSLPCC